MKTLANLRQFLGICIAPWPLISAIRAGRREFVMKDKIQRFLAAAFPLMALTGLLLAAYVLVITPEDSRGGPEIAAAWGLDGGGAPKTPGWAGW